jgi:hypothetical protein
MKANIANNDIEELHKEGMQYARCEFRNPDNDAPCGCPLQLRTRAPETACPKEF